jgi:hypothetical protein
MELKINAALLFKLLHLISWIVFIGLCIEAGSYIFNAIFTIAVNPINASYLNLSALHDQDAGNYIVIIAFMTIVAILKALLFYLLVKLFYEKKIVLHQPFTSALVQFISNSASVTLGIGLVAYSAKNYILWLINQGIKMPNLETLGIAGADVWLFMGIVLLAITQFFKKGKEIQDENELTI